MNPVEYDLHAVWTEQTKPHHKKAESSLMQKVLRNLEAPTAKKCYHVYMETLQPVYAMLEASLTLCSDQKWIAPFHKPEMYCASNMRTDIRICDCSKTTPAPKLTAVIQEIRSLAQAILNREEDSEAADLAAVKLIAISATMHLAALAGGMIIKGIFSRKPEWEKLVNWYHFPEIATSDDFKTNKGLCKEFRLAYDKQITELGLKLNEAQREAFIEASQWTFAFHGPILDGEIK